MWPGFERGRNLDKLGLHSQDTAEPSVTDVRVPKENVLGEVGRGFEYRMRNLAQERMQISVACLAQARVALRTTIEYVGGREAFGQPLGIWWTRSAPSLLQESLPFNPLPLRVSVLRPFVLIV
ncbi:acyl-CoA dehydrogenase family protein [Nocardia sp. NPDC046763]|uniref:acyl-CoA dehydrogenase family protein n=1 Tax=Nocardia sp. NPDC046763 TaxID=3155256 RepID=UPI0034041D79